MSGWNKVDPRALGKLFTLQKLALETFQNESFAPFNISLRSPVRTNPGAVAALSRYHITQKAIGYLNETSLR